MDSDIIRSDDFIVASRDNPSHDISSAVLPRSVGRARCRARLESIVRNVEPPDRRYLFSKPYRRAGGTGSGLSTHLIHDREEIGQRLFAGRRVR
jgi:hypothetical protein